MSIPTQRTAIQPSLIWHREGDFYSEPLELGVNGRGTVNDAAQRLLEMPDVVRADLRLGDRVDIRYTDGSTASYYGVSCLPSDVTCDDVANHFAWLPATPANRALEELLAQVADDAQVADVPLREGRLLVATVGPDVALREGV
ncbi:hypothetical protein [Kineosporia succinea]|uniref:Uncharacterized protein n=1 Tax=Kineosporia succinea TaxID=84632 RepID=A0ABT9PA43_9ACTN|nr:hypothetical protein [Kineosporia succinea]MDP9829352.1 hypothetical protein [Kineosporia succinea]